MRSCVESHRGARLGGGELGKRRIQLRAHLPLGGELEKTRNHRQLPLDGGGRKLARAEFPKVEAQVRVGGIQDTVPSLVMRLAEPGRKLEKVRNCSPFVV
jgi:hypothetical protein